MRTTLFRILCLIVAVLLLNACDKASPVVDNPEPDDTIIDYPVEVNTIIATSQLRALHTGQDITLTKENMSGAHRLAVVVTSDHSAGNLPDGWLVAQDRRHQGMLRGITIPMTVTEAEKYVPGDSLVIDIEGGVLTRVNGHLQLISIPGENVVKIASRRHIPENRLSIETIAANPGTYESTFITTETALGFTPAAVQGDKLSGNKTLVRGTGQLTLTTRTDSPLAELSAPITARFSGVLSNSANGPVLHLRTATDMNVITGFDPIVVPEPHVDAPTFVISGWMADATGDDKDHEYIQFFATQDIDFAATPYSIVTTNNAGNSLPTGIPINGWATGGVRTYKIDITSGTAKKGTYFYVGGTAKLINGAGSTSIADANWVRTIDYVNSDGDGFGTKVNGLLADCGNPSGIAVFKGTDVTVDSEPEDVILIRHSWPGDADVNFIGYDGNNVLRGYRITDTDHYKKSAGEFFYQSVNGTRVNNWAVRYNGNCSNLAPGRFWNLGGVFNVFTNEWETVRRTGDLGTTTHVDNALLHVNNPTSLSQIETANSTKLSLAP